MSDENVLRSIYIYSILYDLMTYHCEQNHESHQSQLNRHTWQWRGMQSIPPLHSASPNLKPTPSSQRYYIALFSPLLPFHLPQNVTLNYLKWSFYSHTVSNKNVHHGL